MVYRPTGPGLHLPRRMECRVLSSTFKNEQAEIIALKHHHPETRLQYLVAIADRLSAAEREDNTNDADDVARIPLHSILASIQGIRNISVEYKPSYKNMF